MLRIKRLLPFDRSLEPPVKIKGVNEGDRSINDRTHAAYGLIYVANLWARLETEALRKPGSSTADVPETWVTFVASADHRI
jgi:hypothetical protein